MRRIGKVGAREWLTRRRSSVGYVIKDGGEGTQEAKKRCAQLVAHGAQEDILAVPQFLLFDSLVFRDPQDRHVIPESIALDHT